MIKRLRYLKLESILVGLILLAATVIRIWTIDYDLPYVYHPDEPINLEIIQNIFKTGDLNPHFFAYPSLFFYINSLAYVPYYLGGKVVGVFTTRADILPLISQSMGVTYAEAPGSVLFSRLITVLFAIGTVVLTFHLGKRLQNKSSTGFLAALLVAFSHANVFLSQSVTPDTFVTFFATAAFLASLYVFQQGKTRHYIIAGFLVGLTASTKYTGALILITVPVAHFLRHGLPGFRDRNIYISLATAALAFLITTPYSVLDSSTFWQDLQYERQHYSTGHAGMEGDAFLFYLGYSWNTLGPICIAALAGLFWGLYSRSKEIILLSSFPIVYFIVISSYTVRNDRTFLPLTPFIFLLAASIVSNLLSWVRNERQLRARTIPTVIALAIVAVLLAWPVYRTVNGIINRTQPDIRELSRTWISENIPAGSQIAVEPYSPYLNPDMYVIQGMGNIYEPGPDWFIENGFDYLIFSSYYYDRYYLDPDRYSYEASQYDRLFEQFSLVKRFDDGRSDILIYAVKR